jgi:uncharacterized protein
MTSQPSFEFRVDDDATIDSRLVVGFASPGMASLVAVDHLVTELQTTQVGHASSEFMPTVTPFTDGKPRRPIRLYETGVATDISLLVSEVFFPIGLGERFADAVIDLADRHDIGEITIPYGVAYPHGEEEHAVFSVTTETYPLDRLEDVDVTPLKGGFLDGAIGRLLERGLDDDAPAVGTLVTPAHPPGPDFDGAILLLEAVRAHTGLDIDTAELEARSAEIHRYYEELAERMQSVGDDRTADYPEDRMFM